MCWRWVGLGGLTNYLVTPNSYYVELALNYGVTQIPEVSYLCSISCRTWQINFWNLSLSCVELSTGLLSGWSKTPVLLMRAGCR